MADNTSKAENKAPAFDIARIYVKDLSLETPNTPAVFKENWQPETKLDLDVRNSLADEANHVYEVVLRLTATVKVGDKTAFLIEVNQAGLFHIENVDERNLDHMLNAFIPNILFPYAREVLSALSNRASFPPLNLAPINFEAIYAQKLKQQSEAQKSEN